MPIFYMTIGIPGSGKSTWASEQKHTTPVVCPDYIRKQLTGNVSDQTKNAEVWKIAKERVSSYLEEGRNVILDATNVKMSDRNRFMRDLPYCYKIAVVFETDPKDAFARIEKDIANGKDRSNVPMDVVARMYNYYIDGKHSIVEEFDEVIWES